MSESIGSAQYRTVEYRLLFVIELSVYWTLDADRTSRVERGAAAGAIVKLFDMIFSDVSVLDGKNNGTCSIFFIFLVAFVI